MSTDAGFCLTRQSSARLISFWFVIGRLPNLHTGLGGPLTNGEYLPLVNDLQRFAVQTTTMLGDAVLRASGRQRASPGRNLL